MKYCYFHSPIGPICITSNDSAITGLYLLEQPCKLEANAVEDANDPVLRSACKWLEEYFQGRKPDPALLTLCPMGTEFQRSVWQLLLQIPYGETITYGDLARQLSPNMSAQAVGQAVGRNPISIIIPCHRVMGSGSRLTGYAGGIHYKVWLLRHEGHDINTLIYPKKSRGN